MFLCTVYLKWTLIINIKEHASILSIFLQFFNFEGLFKEDCFITSFFLDLNSVYFLSYLFVFPIQYCICICTFNLQISIPLQSTLVFPCPMSPLSPTTPLVAAVAGSIPMGNENIPPPPSHRDKGDSYSQTIP